MSEMKRLKKQIHEFEEYAKGVPNLVSVELQTDGKLLEMKSAEVQNDEVRESTSITIVADLLVRMMQHLLMQTLQWLCMIQQLYRMPRVKPLSFR